MFYSVPGMSQADIISLFFPHKIHIFIRALNEANNVNNLGYFL